MIIIKPSTKLYVQKNPSRREIIEINTIKKLIISYFDIIKKNICDSVPKTIITMLVN